MAYIVLASIVLAYVVMAYIVMVYKVMTYIVMACYGLYRYSTQLMLRCWTKHCRVRDILNNALVVGPTANPKKACADLRHLAHSPTTGRDPFSDARLRSILALSAFACFGKKIRAQARMVRAPER